MKDNRPVNLNLTKIQLPITAYVSILHRASGVFIFIGLALLLCMLDQSLTSQESFDGLLTSMASLPAKAILWLVLTALAYHTFAGVKHLIMDLGVGESLEGGVMGARIVLATSVVAALLLGVWIW